MSTKISVAKRFRLVIKQPALVHKTTYIDTACDTFIEALELVEELRDSMSHPNGKFHVEIYKNGICVSETDYVVEL